MSRAIKVEDKVYDQLDELRGKRETFSAVVARLLIVFNVIKQVSDTLGPAHHLNSSTGGDSAEET
ncbi:hypothetical protein ES708_27846 [subsurface metagenome]